MADIASVIAVIGIGIFIWYTLREPIDRAIEWIRDQVAKYQDQQPQQLQAKASNYYRFSDGNIGFSQEDNQW